MSDKRDANESELVDALRQIGCVVIPMDRHAGFDLIVVSPRTGVHIVEVKNPLRRWKLTANELETKARITHAGASYEIIETVEDVMRMVTDDR